MVYILIAVVMFGVLIFVHELGHFAAAKLLGVRVNEFAMGMGPAIFQREKGETLYSLRAFPIGGYCAMEGEDDDSAHPGSFGKAAGWKKFVILVAGSGMNFLTGLLLCGIYLAGSTAFVQPVIAGFAPGFPAELMGQAGLMEGDRILSVDGERIRLYSDITMFFARSNGETMDLVVRRGAQRLELEDYPLFPRQFVENGESKLRYGLNFLIEEATLASKWEHSWYMAQNFVRLVRLSLGELFSGGAGLRDLTGPVGIVDTITQVGSEAESVARAMYPLLYLAALIAVNLAVMNLLPLPALDGGRILFLLLNGLCYFAVRRRIPAKYEGYVHMAGMALLLCLMLAVTFSDIGRLLGI